jgi:septal ring factor EnvC (AmiA/AmiB activator)
VDYKEQLEQIETNIQEKKEEKIRLEEKQKQLESDKKDLVAQLVEEGLTPETLEAEIKKLEAGIKEGIAKCNSISNEDNEPDD